ncbi:HEAT repeat domain-containing protein [Stenotrophomonas maltophilia]|nr:MULTISPECIES: HEAT repeat domain-containing protein [Stenotrophomonas]MBH1541468.1 HEAT repeat domain-containing protein [Stenotrophomonas maltophilia]MBN4984490.1 HEAT repeat domain-containing protein [Stenotrophomonas maltophilia]MDZ7473670.1 HEAT repeat domain-containing protein [Stenotrophomonas pavanii]
MDFARGIEQHLLSPGASLAGCIGRLHREELIKWTRDCILEELSGNGQPSQEAFAVTLAQGPAWQLKVVQQSVNTRFLYTQPFELVVMPLNGALTVETWEIAPYPLLAEGSRIQHCGSAVLEAGSALLCGASGTVHDLRIQQPTLVAKLIGAVREPLQWMIDREQGEVVQAISSSPVHSELEIMARTLGALRDGGAETLASLASHESHFVRWSAMQAMGRVDVQQALQLLDHARNDANAQIRQSASKVLARHAEARS